MKIVIRPQHIISLGGYIVETDFPYRNVIVVNPTEEPIKLEVPVFHEEWIEEQRQLGLEITPLTEKDNYLSNFRKAKARLDKLKAEKGIKAE
ncbi:energy-converting hydrogenase B subunit P [Methanobacterium sp.]|uniref:energy-converting hydrogenase B subunit P n=1 Tax=Methanobacterium sp. TaxID=2164 RepID=UPI0025DDDF26|nr:energy-converting hydrogenase B subunit P [Methanobacterium sp.]MBI5459520.1 energy-converting hydrogenase B subunit EhbP [Methanobacterium sp.]MDY9923828.1 energy-converting hydrogenase B subunit P [Methanobacterium sp.]